MTPTDTPSSARRGWLVRALDGLAALCMFISAILLVTLIVIFGWLVFGRYVLNDTPTWVEQASLVIVVWITFLGAATGVRRKTHLSIAFIREDMPALPRIVLRWVATLGVIAFGGFMAWQGWEVTSSTWTRSIPILKLPEGLRAAPMAVCGGLMVLFTLDDLAALLRGRDIGG